MLFLRGLCVFYWSLLTLLLLVPNPGLLLGWVHAERVTGSRGVHLAAFVVLGLLVPLSRIGWGWLRLAAALIAYALVVEWLQRFIPPRTVELLDYAENLLGLAIGLAVSWWLDRRWGGSRRA